MQFNTPGTLHCGKLSLNRNRLPAWTRRSWRCSFKQFRFIVRLKLTIVLILGASISVISLAASSDPQAHLVTSRTALHGSGKHNWVVVFIHPDRSGDLEKSILAFENNCCITPQHIRLSIHMTITGNTGKYRTLLEMWQIISSCSYCTTLMKYRRYHIGATFDERSHNLCIFEQVRLLQQGECSEGRCRLAASKHSVTRWCAN